MEKDSGAHLFDHQDYKQYLRESLGGKRSAFSRALGCQPAYLSRVLNGEAQLSLEQADKASVFLNHTPGEERYFFYLLLWNRAGTPSLRAKLGKEVSKLKDRHLTLRNRVPLRQPLSLDRQVTYYSAWYYAATHMLLDIDEDWTPQKISRTLGLTLKKVSSVLQFLGENGLITPTRTGYKILERETHVDAESVLVTKHHINWRLKAIQNLEREEGNRNQLHYSSVVTIARKDIPRVREILLTAIEAIRKTVRATSPEEVLYSYGIDLFPVSAEEN